NITQTSQRSGCADKLESGGQFSFLEHEKASAITAPKAVEPEETLLKIKNNIKGIRNRYESVFLFAIIKTSNKGVMRNENEHKKIARFSQYLFVSLSRLRKWQYCARRSWRRFR